MDNPFNLPKYSNAVTTSSFVGDSKRGLDLLSLFKRNRKSQKDFEVFASKAGLHPAIANFAAGGLVAPEASFGKSGVVQKLIGAIKGASKSRGILEEAYTAERAARAFKGSSILKTGGESGAKGALGTLKGELVQKPTFSPVRNLFDQTEVDGLFNQVEQAKNLDFFEKVSTNDGLWKLLKGEVPPKSQLSLLEDVFGSELIEAVRTHRTGVEKLKEGITDVMNIPRSLITSVDMSAPLRQGVLFTLTKPKQSIPAFQEMFKDFFSEKNFNQWLADIPNNPRYQSMKDSGLYLANPNKVSGGLGAREESFMSNLAEKIPVWGSLVKGSSRAYIGYLNKLRVDVFTNLASQFEKDGIATPENLKSLANFVNAGTGRGDLGRFNRVSAELNSVFFSPRLIASRLNMLNPAWYFKQTPAVRKEAIKTFAQFLATGSAILGISAGAGADVELDPRSTDFGKMKVGNTRWDVWGGFQQWARVFSQIASGSKKTTQGNVVPLSKNKYPFTSRFDVGLQFARGKLAPVPGLITELLDGQKLFGGELKLNQEVAENMVPLYLQDMKDAINEFGPEAIFSVGVPAFFGVGTQTYSQPKSSTNPFNR